MRTTICAILILFAACVIPGDRFSAAPAGSEVYVYPLCREVGCPDTGFCNEDLICLCHRTPEGPFITCAISYPRCAPLECDTLTCELADSSSCLCTALDGRQTPCTEDAPVPTERR